MATFDSVNPARPSEVIGTYPAQGPAGDPTPLQTKEKIL